MRDLRDYRVQTESGRGSSAGGSPFDIIATSLRLGDSSPGDVKSLLGQHVEETGQEFTAEAVDRIWAQSLGQPWLVNALCREACFKSERGRDRNRAITEEDVLEAQETLILQRSVHIDQLADKLKEERARRVIEPLLSGIERPAFTDRGIEYVRDLGLVARDAPLRIANPIYREVVPRELTSATQEALTRDATWFADASGGLDKGRLMDAFQDYFRQHSEFWLERYKYKEAGPHLLLHAFLQRVVNGGGRIEREYGLGRMRTDLLVIWPRGGSPQRFVIKCKVLRGELETAIRDGMAQVSGHMDRCGAEAGHFVIFDRSQRRWEETVFRRQERGHGSPIDVWGM